MVYFFNSLVAITLAVAGLVRSAPIEESGLSNSDVFGRGIGMADREVINCEITSPTKKTSWTAGERVTVTWDPSCVSKARFQNYTGTLLLGHKVPGKSSMHLRAGHPLDDDFLLRKGKTSFTLPANITTRSTYFVVLMGNSGNKSPQFTIESE